MNTALILFAIVAAVLTIHYYYQQQKYKNNSANDGDGETPWRDWSENEIEPIVPIGEGIMDEVMQDRPEPGQFKYGPPPAPPAPATSSCIMEEVMNDSDRSHHPVFEPFHPDIEVSAVYINAKGKITNKLGNEILLAPYEDII